MSSGQVVATHDLLSVQLDAAGSLGLSQHVYVERDMVVAVADSVAHSAAGAGAGTGDSEAVHVPGGAP